MGPAGTLLSLKDYTLCPRETSLSPKHAPPLYEAHAQGVTGDCPSWLDTPGGKDP